MGEAQDYRTLQSKLADRRWRLNNLYYIKDKAGRKTLFRMNWAQEFLFENIWFFNVILKARQLGFTTFILIYFLDACLFNSDHSAGVIAHNLEDAKKLFKDKVKYAYDNLPEWLKEQRSAKSDSARTLEFINGSSIYVGTSLRSGTLQKLLVSEYGKISAKYPEKAKEVKTGALNTIEAGQQIFVESTAEGKVGEFFDLVERARKLADSLKKLARLEPKFFFFPWWRNSSYRANEEETEHTVITEEYSKYFDELSEQGIELTGSQKAWYVIKAEQQGDDMMQEYPSTPEESFQGSLKGAYYTKSMKHVRENGQICHLPYDSRFGVYTWWDLGLNDQMVVWFYQKINGRHCFIDYHESDSEGWEYYANMLKEKGYNYIAHNFPHDGNKRVRGKQVFTDRQIAQECGIRPVKITPRTSNTHDDVVKICAPVLKNCWFDQEKCSQGILHLDNYKKKYSRADQMFRKEPEHNEASHGADGFRTFAVNADKIGLENNETTKVNRSRPQRRGTATSWMG